METLMEKLKNEDPWYNASNPFNDSSYTPNRAVYNVYEMDEYDRGYRSGYIDRSYETDKHCRESFDKGYAKALKDLAESQKTPETIQTPETIELGSTLVSILL